MRQDRHIALVRSAASSDAYYLCRGMATTLDYVGLQHRTMSETDAASARLRPFRLALLPCNPNPTPRVLEAVREFVHRGGKLILGLNAAPELLALLGLTRVKTREANVGEMLFTHKALHGLPQRLFLSTRRFATFKASDEVRMLAQWHTLEDLTLQDPAAYLSPYGALLSTALAGEGEHTQFAEDRMNLGRVIASLVNHFVPGFDRLRFQRQLTGQLSGEEDLVRNARSRDFEMRALWTPKIPTPNEVAIAARRNFNLLCPNLGPIAAQHYECRTFRRPWLAAEPLTKCVDQAHRNGMEAFPYVTAWPLPTAELARFFDGTSRLSNFDSASPSNPWMCASHPENQRLLIEGVTQLMDEFGLDGVAVGGIRFHDASACNCAGCRERFQKWLERKIAGRTMNLAQRKSAWQNWRKEVLTDLLKRLLTACRATNPNARLAVVTQPSWTRAAGELGQDAALWAQQQLADVFIPLNFTATDDALRGEMNDQLANVSLGSRLCVGLGIYTSTSELPSPAALVRQIERVHQMEADGFLLWHAQPRLFERLFVEPLQAGVLKSPSKLPWHPNAPRRERFREDIQKSKPTRAARMGNVPEC